MIKTGDDSVSSVLLVVSLVSSKVTKVTLNNVSSPEYCFHTCYNSDCNFIIIIIIIIIIFFF